MRLKNMWLRVQHQERVVANASASQLHEGMKMKETLCTFGYKQLEPYFPSVENMNDETKFIAKRLSCRKVSMQSARKMFSEW